MIKTAEKSAVYVKKKGKTMKKILALVLVAALLLCVGCGITEPITTSESTQPITETRGTGENSTIYSTTNPDPSPMNAAEQEVNETERYVDDAQLEANGTYTGRIPLKTVNFKVIDADNSRGLSTKTHNHSFGVSQGAKPHQISVDNQKYYEKYNAFCLDTSGQKVIYLTFDCGYENGCTGKILDTLKKKNIKAAFFMTLSNVKSNPKLVARMINEGHIVGNHSASHPNFSEISRTRMAEEIQKLDNYLRTKFGYSSPYFRFPEGACSDSALDLVNSIGFKSVFWSTAYNDWDINNPKGADYAFETVTSRLHSGCVLLLHSVSTDNADALGRIIDYAKAQGYEFKTLDEYGG